MNVTPITRALRGAEPTGRTPLPASATLVLVPAGLLLAGGLMMILSASSVAASQEYGSAFPFFLRQLLWAAVGIAALVACASIDFRRWRGWSYLLLLAAAAGLVAVLLPGVGVVAGGSSRWLAAGPLRVQPSELMKLALLLVAADLCVRKGRRLASLSEILLPLGIIAILVGALVLAQPDLGTTLILGLIVFAILFVAGVPIRLLAGLGVAGAGAALLAAVTEGYRRARLFSFVDPWADRLGDGYQVIQSMIALGSGGLFGVGLGASRQKWLYVPNAHTDFIFAIIGEETGLVGTLLVLSLFCVLTYAGVRIARRAPDPFGRLVAAGITVWIAGQALINIGGVTGIMPITGVPLPLVSFGGSALVFTMAALGILVAIARREVWPPRPSPQPAPAPPAREDAGP